MQSVLFSVKKQQQKRKKRKALVEKTKRRKKKKKKEQKSWLFCLAEVRELLPLLWIGVNSSWVMGASMEQEERLVWCILFFFL
jgi:hypothetical protein